MKKSLIAAAPAALMLSSSAALAFTAYTTADLNVRTGPGTVSDIVMTVPSGTAVEVEGCLENQSWCRIEHNGAEGWASGSFLAYGEADTGMPLAELAEGVLEIPMMGAELAARTAGATVGAFRAGVDAMTGIDEPDDRVTAYVEAAPAEDFYVAGDLAVGVGLPAGVATYAIPDYEYHYAYVNDRRVLVDPRTRRVVYVY